MSAQPKPPADTSWITYEIWPSRRARLWGIAAAIAGCVVIAALAFGAIGMAASR